MQVLAGAGPAVAAVPLVVVWAGGSAFNLVQGIARRQVGVRGTVSRVGFVGGQTVAQVLGGPLAAFMVLNTAKSMLMCTGHTINHLIK